MHGFDFKMHRMCLAVEFRSDPQGSLYDSGLNPSWIKESKNGQGRG